MGDTFRYNRCALGEDGTLIEGAVFTITKKARGFVYFRSEYDAPVHRDRRLPLRTFLGEVRTRLLVRHP